MAKITVTSLNILTKISNISKIAASQNPLFLSRSKLTLFCMQIRIDGKSLNSLGSLPQTSKTPKNPNSANDISTAEKETRNKAQSPKAQIKLL